MSLQTRTPRFLPQPGGLASMLGLLLLGAQLALPSQARADVILCDTVSGNLVANCGFETGNFNGWTQAGNTTFTSVTGTLNGVDQVTSEHLAYNPNSGGFM